MPSFANADNAFMGVFANIPNKGASAPEAAEQPMQEESTEQAELHPKESQEPSSSEPAAHKRGRKKKGIADCDDKSSPEVGHFSCICNSKLIVQVRAIAWKEHLTVRAVVESMFSKCIAKYEKKHGPIQTGQSRPAMSSFDFTHMYTCVFSVCADAELLLVPCLHFLYIYITMESPYPME